jgi:uncharacterized protein YciI
MDLESVTVVLLQWGARAQEFSEEELDALQERHLAYQQRLRDEGHLLAGGPFEDQPDVTWRGFGFYRTGVEEARRLAEQDPAVVAGRLRIEAWRWWFRAGEVVFPRDQGASGARPIA